MVLVSCEQCKTKDEVDEVVFNVFPEAEVVCPKCKKAMKGSATMPQKALEVEKQDTTKHPSDPRQDLKDDADIWIELLNRLWVLKKELYYTFHFLRCAGSTLELQTDNIQFTFSDELSKEIVDKVRKEQLAPNKEVILIVLKRLAKDLNDKKTFNDCPF